MTKQSLNKRKEKCLLLIKPDGLPNCGKIISSIQDLGLTVARIQMLKFDDEMVRVFFQD